MNLAEIPMRIRPCIDMRDGRVVQIVGGTLTDKTVAAKTDTVVNFSTERRPAVFARRYRADRLTGGHIISLGPGNQEAALVALSTFPGGMQMGGGVTPENAGLYLDAGASHVIVTSYVFREGKIDEERLAKMVSTVGIQRLVLDLSCRKRDGKYWVVTDRWQRFTDVTVNREMMEKLSAHCAEFLVHAVDVEGKQSGVDIDLVERLGMWSPIPITYAGGVRTWDDVENVRERGKGRVDLTIGSALDIFGGKLRYRDLVAWQRREETLPPSPNNGGVRGEAVTDYLSGIG